MFEKPEKVIQKTKRINYRSLWAQCDADRSSPERHQRPSRDWSKYPIGGNRAAILMPLVSIVS